jgi:hypothetical protein
MLKQGSHVHTITHLNQKLASKFYLNNVGLFLAIAGVLGFMYTLNAIVGLSLLVSIFIAYFVVVFCRAFYDQLLILELNFSHISIKNNLLLASIGAGILTVLYHVTRAPLGNWAIPVTVILSMKIIGAIKKFLWPNTAERLPEFLKIYSKKIQTYVWGLYGFFLVTAMITYQLVKLYGSSYFYFSFAAAVFIGLITEQLYDLVAVYDIKPTPKAIAIIIIFSALLSIFCSGFCFLAMQLLGLSGKIATISGIIVLKLIQPLALNLLLTND